MKAKEAEKAEKNLFLQRVFDKYAETSNHAYNVTLAASIGWGLALFFTCLTRSTLLGPIGLAFFAVALPGALVSFAAQTKAQIAHCKRNAIAKKCGSEPIEFRQEKPLGARLIKGTLSRAFNVSKTIARPCSTRTANVSVRTSTHSNHARAHRSASRPTFSSTSSSSSSGGGSDDSGGSDSSGSSDSGDDPPPLVSTATPSIPLCTQKSHSNPVQELVLVGFLETPCTKCRLSCRIG